MLKPKDQVPTPEHPHPARPRVSSSSPSKHLVSAWFLGFGFLMGTLGMLFFSCAECETEAPVRSQSGLALLFRHTREITGEKCFSPREQCGNEHKTN